MDATVAMSRDNTGLKLCLALNYGSRQEIIDAVKTIACKIQRGTLLPEKIDEHEVSNALYTAGLPDPDLLIRTANERRISNFLLWQIAYAELYVTETLWPDFRLGDLLRAILEYQKRDRRFGGLTAAEIPAEEEQLVGVPAK